MIKLRPGALRMACDSLGGVSLEALARRMQVSASTVYRADRGDHLPSTRLLARLIVTTGMRFEDLAEVIDTRDKGE